MMKKFTYALFAFTLLLSSCSDDDPGNPPQNPPGPYASGIIFYGTTYEDLAFYNPANTTFYEGNLFEEINGETVGESSMSGGINDVYIYNGKGYLLTPKTSETGENANKARIAVTDAETFELERSIYADGFAISSLGYIYSLMVVNENKFYIGYNPSSNNSGIRVLTVAGDGSTTFSDDISGTAGPLGVDGPATYQRMLRHGNWVVAACGSKIQFISTSTDQTDGTKTIEIDERRQVADVLKGRDGYIYALVAGESDKDGAWLWYGADYETPASIVKIDPSSLAIVYEEELLDEQNEQMDIKAGMEANGAVASLTSDEILFTVGAVYGSCQVYAFNYTDKTTRQVAAPTGMFGKYMAADRLGNVYVPQIVSYEQLHTQVYRISDGERMTGIEETIGQVKGDGGFVSTYMFR